MNKHTPEEHHDHNEHAHVHDISEVIDATQHPTERRKLLISGAANALLVVGAVTLSRTTGASPSFAEAVHNIGDVGFYMVPWLTTVRHHVNSKKAAVWMRRTAMATALIAGGGAAHEVSDLANGSYERPHPISVPGQVALAGGNIGVALYWDSGKKKQNKCGGSVIKKSSLRHARRDAQTSVVAAGFNALSLAMPAFNPLGAIIVNGLTIHAEKQNIDDINNSSVIGSGETFGDVH